MDDAESSTPYERFPERAGSGPLRGEGKGCFVKYSVSLKSNRDFRRLYSRGKRAVSPTLALYARRGRPEQNRLGITVSKKLGNAVTRNKVCRRLREVYRLHEEQFLPGRDIVVVARVRAAHVSYQVLERDFLRLARRLNLLRALETAQEERP